MRADFSHDNSEMKVILLSDVNGLGKVDDIVVVNDGYARNFLFKKEMALEATSTNLNTIKLRKGSQAKRAKEELEEAGILAKKLAGQRIVLQMKSGEGGRLYGAVTAIDIAAALDKKGFKADKKNIILKSPIKSVGEYEISMKLHPEVMASVIVEITTAE